MTCNMQMKKRRGGLYANGIQSQIFPFTVSHLFAKDTALLFCRLWLLGFVILLSRQKQNGVKTSVCLFGIQHEKREREREKQA